MKKYPVVADSDAAIRIGEKVQDPNETRWGLLLVLFMRIVAGLWILQGLVQWQIILMAPTTIFDHVSKPTAIAVVYFAVIDLIAAVGLWLATPWGGVLWLLVTLSQIVVAWVLPDFFGSGRIVIALDIILIGFYLTLTYYAGLDPEERSAPFILSPAEVRKSIRRWSRRNH